MFRATLIPLIPLLLGAPAAGQQVVSARAGLIYYTEGAVFFDGAPARSLLGTRYPTLENGQVISTERGHAEILLGAGAVLWVGLDSKVRLEDTRLDDTRIRVESGSGIIEVRNIPQENRIRVGAGEVTLDLTRQGLYRFDADPPRVRVYDGELMAPGAVRVRQNQEALLSDKSAPAVLDRGRRDEFHYWAAWRSYQLAGETGFDGGRWSLQGIYREAMRHSGFGIEFPLNPGAARLQYLAATTGGLVYYLKGGALLGGPNVPRQIRVPFRLASESTLGTEAGGWAEIFLGVGVVARLGENAKIRMLDATPMDTAVILDEGKALIEVSRAAENTRVRVAVGESVTEILKPGLYEFDGSAAVLRVYGGEASTLNGDRKSRSREGQMLTLAAAPSITRFDTKQKDPLYQWGYERSLILARSNGVFMTQWERVGRLLRHPQFGSVDRRTGR
jgi:hypothetical protein